MEGRLCVGLFSGQWGRTHSSSLLDLANITVVSKRYRRQATRKLQALLYDILPSILEEGAGKRCSECGLHAVSCTLKLVESHVCLRICCISAARRSDDTGGRWCIGDNRCVGVTSLNPAGTDAGRGKK